MPVDLTRFEQGAPFAGDYEAALAALQTRLSGLHTRQIVHGRRSLIVLEGWSGAGKKGTLKRLSPALDPCHMATHCVGELSDDERERHWLARFWSSLPASGDTAIFYNSWHHRVVDRMLSGSADTKAAARACDEINEFENQQHEHGTAIIKLFFHVPAGVQAERLRARQVDEWRRWTVTDDDLRSLHSRPAAQGAWERLFAQTDTRWAPWTVIDAGNKQAARIAALEAIAGGLAKAMPAHPPAGEVKVAALGLRAV
jgi:polyphosphate kinase 2 (PPK2 family)